MPPRSTMSVMSCVTRASFVLLVLLSVAALLVCAGTFTGFGPKNYTRGTGAPVTVTDTFSVLNPNTQYTLKAFNGGLQNSESELVSSSVVTLNGVQVLGPSDFNQNVTEIDVPVTLQASNTISVQVRGQPGGVLTILIVGVDNQPPTIKASVSPAPNAAGWNNTNVTVTFTCADAISGIATCPPSQTVTTEGANQVISGTATDNAGNTASTSVTLNIAKTPSKITAAGLPAPNANGWNNSNVTVNFTCTPTVAPLATCPQPQTVSTEGAAQIISGTATDLAGNSNSASVTINLEKTPPIITANVSPSPNAAGWNNSNVTVSFQCGTSLSGGVQCPASQTVSKEGAGQVITGTVSDTAGNQASASITINLDKTAPTLTVTAPANGAAVTLPSVTVTGTATDSLSGVASVSCAGTPATISGSNFSCLVPIVQGPNSISAKATDIAGNTAQTSVLVQGGIPTLVSVSPNTGQQGQQNLSVTITGQSTNLVQGTTTASFGAGVTVVSLAVNSATNATAVLNIDPTAATGARTVTLATSAEVVTLGGGFTVTPGTPALTQVSPSTGQQGQQSATGSIFLTGHDPDFHAFFGGNNAPGAQDFNRAAIGFVMDRRFNPFVAGGASKFLFVESKISPPSGHVTGEQGIAASGFTLGIDFDWVDAGALNNALDQLGTTYGAMVVASDFGGDLTQAELDILNARSTDIIAFLNQGGGLYAMAESAVLTTKGDFGFLPFVVSSTAFGQFESGNTLTPFGSSLGLLSSDINGNVSHNIFAGTFGLQIVDHDSANDILSLAGRGMVSSGQVIGPIEITGQFTHFLQASTTASFGQGITVLSLVVTSPTSATVVIKIDPSAALGPRTVTMSTGTEVVSLPNGFTVTPGTPLVVSVSPNSGQQGQANLPVTLTGQFTHFAQGSTGASFGTGITVTSLTVNSSTSATATLSIDQAATLGVRNATLTTGTEVITLANAFAVTAGTPMLVSVNPASGAQGAQNLSVAIGGQFTHFAQGTTTASVGAGVTVVSLTVTSATTATAVINIDPATATGPKTVTLTTGSEVATLINGFSVSGTPVLIQVSPNTGQQRRQNLIVTLTGQFTNWLQGTTTATFGPGINVVSLTVNSPTNATADLNIDCAAPGVPRDVTLTTGTEVDTSPHAFTVVPLQAFFYVSNSGNTSKQIQAFGIDGATGTLTPVPGSPFSLPGTNPNFMAVTPSGRFLYVANGGPTQISALAIDRSTGALTEIAGSPFSVATFVTSITIDPSGLFLYATSVIQGLVSGYSINPDTGALTPVSGSPFTTGSNPFSITLSPSGQFAYVPSGTSGNISAYSIDAITGALTAVPGSPFTGQPGQFSITASPSGRFVYVAEGSGVSAYSVNAATGALNAISSPVPAGTGPRWIAISPAEDFVYVSNGVSNNVSGYTVNRQTGILTAVAGSPFSAGVGPVSLAVDPSYPSCPFTYVADTASNDVMVYRINTATGSLAPVANSPFAAGSSPLAVAIAVPIDKPLLMSLNPNSGQQGQRNLTVNLVGQFTSFVQGTTTVNFGAGVTLLSMTVSSPTSATAIINIDPAATPGSRNVTVTTAGEIVNLRNGFTVTNGLPTLSLVNPNVGNPGQQNLSVALSGQSTHWAQGVTVARFGAGVTVTSLVINSSTNATAVLNIDPAASIGSRDITVTSNTEIVTLSGGFTIAAIPAFISTLNPGFAPQGTTNIQVLITGNNTHFVQGTSVASFGAGITVSSLVVTSTTAATATINIDVTAPVGPHAVTITTNTEIATTSSGMFANGFSVVPGVAGITQISPGGGPQGGQNLSVSINGQFTHFAQGTTTATFGSGITVSSVTVSSPTSASAFLTISPSATLGVRDVTLTTNTEVVTLTAGFSVTPSISSPTITTISPNAGQQGQQNLSVSITGQFTHFAQGTTTASFAAGITVVSLTVGSATTATATINISPTAVTGAQTVTLTTGTEVASLANGFTVTAGIPQLTLVSPNSGQQGQQNLLVGITGQFTHFVAGMTTANFGPGVTVALLTVSSSTSATAVLDIDPVAFLGAHNVTLTTGSEVVTLSAGFTVLQGSVGPAIISLSPNSALPGQVIQITINAQNTHFVQGTTLVNFGPQISVGAGSAGGYGPVQVTSPTTAVAQVSVPNNAVLGPRTVVAQTGSEVASIINGFATVGAPFISSLSPSHAQPGQTISVAITGVFTNFQQGVTQATFGAGISVGGGTLGGPGPVTVTSSSTATAQITIDSAAAPGLRSPVLVATGAEQATFVNSGFLVLGPVTGPGPIVSITSPTEGSEVTAPTTVTGTVTSPNLSNWTLEYEASGSTIFTQFAAGTASAVNGTLDPTLLLNGIAQIRLTGVDQSGQTTSAIVDVVVTRNTKVGNFTLSFNDLTIPVAGIPIQIIRTYDSRNKSSGDFGFGWSLDIQTTKVDVNGILGNNWTGTTTGGAFPTYCVQPNQNYVVSVRAPGGTIYQFAPTLNGGCQQLVPPSTVDMAFTPIGATPPNASLTAANSTGLFVSASFPGQAQLVDLSTSLPFDPDQLTLTLPTGQQLQVSRTFGVQSIKDTNGNSLTITASGITSSAGKGVSFARDAQKRITTITDPSGNLLTYAYDPNGDLATFTDQLNNISTFTYDGSHNLLSFKDPRGIQPIRNVYDDSGRLIQQIDAFSHVINFTHDLGARTETVTDFLGNPTTYVYDSDGNIISTTDALGNVTTATFDAHDNKLSETNALNKTSTYTYDPNNNRLTETDPLSHTTTYAYNSRNQVLTITDALSHVTTNTYDPNGNLLSTKDPPGNSTSYVYNGQGLRTSMTDALGGVTSYQYDASGNLTQQTDPLGNVTSYTYDGNGNKLSQTKTRTTPSGTETLVTSYQYNAQNRLTLTTYPDGSTTQIQYNAIGKQSVTTDQLGRQTSYQYDLMGHLTQTTFPDGTTETSAYDAQGNRIASTDRAGRITTFVYDALKRLTGTTYADGVATATTYDGIGEVTAVTDPRGNQTKYQYDGAGRRTSVTDALSHATSFAYDSVGNQLSMTDANSNTTQYQYDALNRRTKTVYQDGTSDGVAYDALGRTISKTDQAGQVTQFQYDKLGRLTQVTDALSQITKYTYNEVGNRISQTDANTHTTTFAYDKLGRRTKRTLPLGMFESLSYDAAGNLVSKTDFNGKTTSYSYDLLNRLTGKTPDASFGAPSINFAYTSTGQRQTMTDASGTTSYSYDLRDRLTQKATPQGTLSYAYDLAGSLISIQSSNAGGTSVSYAYDALNRLSTVQDNRSASGTTTYGYDNAGNLQGYAYPNGVQTAYSYNTLNRLTNVAISKGATLASYAYRLGPAGNRTQVTELSGRQVGYSYDALYRLTGETISGSTINGLIGYQYDPVGNRLQRTSTVGPVPPATYSYDANDRLAADTYDADGNTTASSGNTYAYDFENRLVSQNSGAVTMVYDGDGNRVAKTAGGVTTKYLVDDRNLTGYAQVLEETVGGSVQRFYTYGLNRISQSQASGTSFYGYDGHGNVRILTDTTGAISDRYDYDAFGNLVSQVGSTPNLYLFSGEQNDPNLAFYYLRARYLNPASGRFSTIDPLCGGTCSDPRLLHKYLYASADPVNQLDPSGQMTLPELSVGIAIVGILSAEEAYVLYNSFARYYSAPADKQFSGIFGSIRVNAPTPGVGLAGGFDVFVDWDTKTACYAKVGEIGVGFNTYNYGGPPSPVSGSLGFYAGGDVCNAPASSWSEEFGLSASIPLSLFKIGANALAPQLPFRGVIQRVANLLDKRPVSVNIGYSNFLPGATNSAFALTYPGSLGLAFSVSSPTATSPYATRAIGYLQSIANSLGSNSINSLEQNPSLIADSALLSGNP